jgi:hypothetical protein
MGFRNHVVRGKWLLIVALTVSVGASLLHGKEYAPKPAAYSITVHAR